MPVKPEHSKVKPVFTDAKFNIIGFVILISAVIGMIIKWKEFYDFFAPHGSLLNWRFFFLALFIAATLIALCLRTWDLLCIDNRKTLVLQIEISTMKFFSSLL